MRVALWAVFAIACGSGPSAPTAPEVDRTPGERPAGTLVEFSFDGGDEALTSMLAQLPPGQLRTGLPSRISVLVDGLIDLPSEIASHLDPSSPIRLVMTRVDGQPRSALAVRLSTPLDTHPGGGPRGTDRIGDHAAVDDLVAVIADDASLLDAAFPYLAYAALPRPSDPGALVIRISRAMLVPTGRVFLEHEVEENRANALASIQAARAQQDRPPDLGDPEALVSQVADAVLARIAYVPDLGEVTLRLEATPSGLAFTMSADVTAGSPLASALAEYVPIPSSLVASMPSESLIVLATGTSAAARASSEGDLVTALAAIAGPRMTAAEHTALDAWASDVAAIRGDQGALALGVHIDRGPFIATATTSTGDAPWRAVWGRALPYTTRLLRAFFRCDASRSAVALCDEGDVARQTRGDGEGLRVDVMSREVGGIASPIAEHRGSTSPDLARDLAALPTSTFATMLVRPLRVLPVLSLLGGPSTGLPHGDGAFVLALAYRGGRLTVSLRASQSAMADVATVLHLFANESDSE